jgi:sugar phosphate isomerase/epimerase
VAFSVDHWPETPGALRDRLGAALDTAAETGTALAIRSAVGAAKLGELISLLGHPMLRASLDPAQAALAGRSVTHELEELGALLSEVRLSDCDAAGLPCPLGCGIAGWSELVVALARRGFAGDLVLCDDGGPDPRFSALRAQNFVRVGVSRAARSTDRMGDAA